MKARLILFLYLGFLLIFGYYAIQALTNSHDHSEPFSAVQPLIYLVAIIFGTFWFSSIYPDLKKQEAIERLHQYAPGMKIRLASDDTQFRLACRVNVMENIIEINYRRMTMYPYHCRVFMILWCYHRAVQHDLNQQRPDDVRKNPLGVVLDADNYAFQDYIGLELPYQTLETYFLRDQLMLGDFKAERYKQMRELIESVKSTEHGYRATQQA